MEENKQTNFLPPLPEVPSEVPRALPFPLSWWPGSRDFCVGLRCAVPSLCYAVRELESTKLDDHLEPSKVGQWPGGVGRRQMHSSSGWGQVAWKGRQSTWVSHVGGCEMGYLFLPLQQPPCVTLNNSLSLHASVSPAMKRDGTICTACPPF